MSCEIGRSVLHGYFDGELDAAGAAEFEGHLLTCADCAAALKSQKSLRSSLQRAELHERAPAGLRLRLALPSRPYSDPPSGVGCPSRRPSCWPSFLAGD